MWTCQVYKKTLTIFDDTDVFIITKFIQDSTYESPEFIGNLSYLVKILNSSKYDLKDIEYEDCGRFGENILYLELIVEKNLISLKSAFSGKKFDRDIIKFWDILNEQLDNKN
jgi:hypothetical protein